MMYCSGTKYMGPYSPYREESVFSEVWRHRGVFLAAFFVAFALSYGVLVVIDFVPETPEEESAQGPVAEAPVAEEPEPEPVVVSTDPYPVRILIDVLDREVKVLNPESATVAALDTALLSGAVRHPDSADLDDGGTMFLFGHSSYLPNVYNKNFQAFNGLQKLVWGDTIRVQSADAEYVYSVEKVYKTSATEATVALDHSSAKLVLVTCNSFGSKDDRFVVEAKLVETLTI